jgi:type I restriction enzyme S subunit
MELKPGYKLTEVGVIPEDWDAKSLESLVTLLTNGFVGTATKSYTNTDEGILYIQGYNVQENGFNLHGIKRVSREFAARNKKSCLQIGDLLTIQTGDIGTTTIVPPELAGANCHALIITRFKRKASEPGYYCQYFNSAQGRSAFKQIETGTTMKHLNGGDMKRLLVPCPPAEEQHAIATTLSGIDAYIAELDLLVTKKQGVKLAAMQELLTGKRRLPGFEGEWDVKRLGDVAHIKTGSKNNEDKVEDGEYPFFVRSDNVERIGSYSYDCEAVLVPGEGRIGDIFHYIKGRFDVHQRVYAITQFTQEVSGKFVHCYLAMNFGAWAMQNTVKATVDSLRLPTFQTFEMRLPPTKEEQDSIAGVLTEIDAELATLEARKVKVQMLKQGMMQQFLTGKIRLK